MKKSLLSLLLVVIMLMSVTTVTAFAAEPVRQAKNKIQIGSGNNLEDKGSASIVMSLEQLVRENTNFRIALWTGDLLQLAAMSIPPGGEVGMEQHKDEDQFLYIIEGHGTYHSGPEKGNMTYKELVKPGSGIFVPKGKWHNITNDGPGSLKLFSVYAPPHHSHGTIHKTKAEAEAAEQH